ncbi:MAG TPA: hypothetical protein DF383_00640 [Deltaproteobacteria bacterium]|nr:hypothetical protein [Deltaproteobacteria bacterium]
MFSFLKKVLSLGGVLLVVALVLNLKVGGRPARDLALEIWQSEGIQKVYRVIRDRALALIRKDISIEDVFKSNPSISSSSKSAEKKVEETRVIQLEKLNDNDRKALEKILQKSSN